jgi:hypothetical protein
MQPPSRHVHIRRRQIIPPLFFLSGHPFLKENPRVGLQMFSNFLS